MPVGLTISAGELATDGVYVDVDNSYEVVATAEEATHVTLGGNLINVSEAVVLPDVISITSDIAPNPDTLKQLTYINESLTVPRILTGSFFGGAPSKTLDPGEAVTITKTAAGLLFIVSAYENLTGGVGTLIIGSTFTIA